MKRSSKWVLVFFLIGGLLSGCGPVKQNTEKIVQETTKTDSVMVSNLASDAVLEEVTAILKENQLSNVDIFSEWVKDYAALVGEKANLAGDWTAKAKLRPDQSACSLAWQEAYDRGEYDSNCRITAFLLLSDRIQREKIDPVYEGTYLMFDLDAVENAEKYERIKEKEALFQNLFGEIDVKEKTPDEIQNAFSEEWDKAACRIESEKVSLFSVVIHDPFDDVVFVGHTGVLIDCGEYLLFVEKIAFEQPYQVSKVKNVEELMDLLCERPEYFGDGTEEGPFFYQNGTFLMNAKGRGPVEAEV